MAKFGPNWIKIGVYWPLCVVLAIVNSDGNDDKVEAWILIVEVEYRRKLNGIPEKKYTDR